MTNNKTVCVGLSGGVDSAVAALLLKKEGWDVTGVTMRIWDNQFSLVSGKKHGAHACLGPNEEEEVAEARRISDLIGIPYKVYDLKKDYSDVVLNYFSREYAVGRTPNPCVVCNCTMKFGRLMDMAIVTQSGFFATGHYARIRHDADSDRYILQKGVDPKKDQSYFLHLLRQEQLARCVFPLGNMTKDEVRRIAVENHLGLDATPESQNFVAGDYASLLKEGVAPGHFVDRSGRILGTHKGIARYTIGQRKGLGIGGGDIFYVTEIDSQRNAVVLGAKTDLLHSECVATGINWIIAPPEPGAVLKAKAKIRYQHCESACDIHVCSEQVTVAFEQPQLSITPGQFIVFYDGDDVLGGGTIEKSDCSANLPPRGGGRKEVTM